MLQASFNQVLGLAHIGIIDWLETQGFEIRSIAGSSMGALVGGLYAAGKLEEYKAWVLTLGISDMMELVSLSHAAERAIARGRRTRPPQGAWRISCRQSLPAQCSTGASSPLTEIWSPRAVKRTPKERSISLRFSS